MVAQRGQRQRRAAALLARVQHGRHAPHADLQAGGASARFELRRVLCGAGSGVYIVQLAPSGTCCSANQSSLVAERMGPCRSGAAGRDSKAYAQMRLHTPTPAQPPHADLRVGAAGGKARAAGLHMHREHAAFMGAPRQLLHQHGDQGLLTT